MRASRLLQILLLLQNRGRMTSGQLASELEVTPRTISRDVDALTEAGLPVIVHRGNQGGIELGFNYRTRLTGLAADEAEAMAVVLTRPIAELAMLGLSGAADRGRAKMLESFPEPVRTKIEAARLRFQFDLPAPVMTDPRVPALAEAIRLGKQVRINTRSKTSRTIHPVGLVFREAGWFVVDGPSGEVLEVRSCGEINVPAVLQPPRSDRNFQHRR